MEIRPRLKSERIRDLAGASTDALFASQNFNLFLIYRSSTASPSQLENFQIDSEVFVESSKQILMRYSS
jgi:hypothetical protein